MIDPETQFGEAKFISKDFDGTAFLTFEEYPELGIYGVDEAYKMAVEEAFPDDPDALKRYEDEGEHNNRSPAEIAYSIAPGMTEDALLVATKKLVKKKLSVLNGQIGQKISENEVWPRPVPGFLETWNRIHEAKDAGEDIDTAIISAGHTSFIEKVLKQYGVKRPDIIVTNETIRGLNSVQPVETLAKPNALPLMIARTQWFHIYRIDPAVDESIKSRMMHAGDSEEKDGGMAEAAGISFAHINPDNPTEGWQKVRDFLEIE